MHIKLKSIIDGVVENGRIMDALLSSSPRPNLSFMLLLIYWKERVFGEPS